MESCSMMNDMMDGMMAGHWLAGLIGLLVLIVLALAAAALVKYLLRSSRQGRRDGQ